MKCWGQVSPCYAAMPIQRKPLQASRPTFGNASVRALCVSKTMSRLEEEAQRRLLTCASPLYQLRSGFPQSMTGLHLDMQQDGIIPGVGCLQSGGEFFGVGGHYTVVGICCQDERGRVGNAGFDVVQRRVDIHELEVFGV